MNIEIVNNRQEILALAGLSLYQSELQEKLDKYIEGDKRLRSRWGVEDLDIHIRKRISTAIVDNEFKQSFNEKGKKIRPRNDKEMITRLSEELGLEIMAVKHVYSEVKEQLQLSNDKEDDRGFITAQLYAHLDEIDLRIENAVDEKDAQEWYKIKMKAIDQFSKVRNLKEAPSNNTAIVHGNVNTQNNTTVDKQIVMSQDQAMLQLLQSMNILEK